MTNSRLRNAVRTVADFPAPGIKFKDITPILSHPQLLNEAVAQLAAPYEDVQITKVVGVESRGFILGGMLAAHLGAGFVPVRKEGKLPAQTVRVAYDLEYGSDVVEMHEDAVNQDDRVLIHDDVIATGGTAKATMGLIQKQGAHLAGFSFLIELDKLEGRLQLGREHTIHSVLHL